MRSGLIPLVRGTMSFAAIVAVCFVIHQQTSGNFGAATQLLTSIQPHWLLTAALAILVSYLVETQAWRLAYESFAQDDKASGFLPTLCLLHLGGMLKYIPGKIWIYLSQATRGQALGFKLGGLLQANIMTTVASIVSGLVISSVFLLLSLPARRPDQTAALACLPVVIAFLGSFVYLAGTPWAMAVIKKNLGRDLVFARPAPSHFFSQLALYFLSWGLTGLGGVWAAMSLGLKQNLTEASVIGSSMAAGWTISFLTLLVPGGLGVREGMMFLLLRERFGTQMALSFPLLTRMIFLACEITLMLGGLGISLSLKKKSQKSSA